MAGNSTPKAWGMRLSQASGVILGVIVPAAVCLALSALAPWWVFTLGVVVVVGVLTSSYHGFTAAQYVAGWRRNRGNHQLAVLPEPVEVSVAAGGAAIIWSRQSSVVALIEVAPTLGLPTVARSDGDIYTEDLVPLGILSSMGRQYGLDLDIRVTQVGRRVPARTTGVLYANTAGPLHLVAQRNTFVIVELDLTKPANLVMTGARGPVDEHAPKALATAVHRIAIRCREHGARARVVATAEQFRRAHERLAGDSATTHWQQRWSSLHGHAPEGGAVSATGRAYWVKGAQLSPEALDRAWAHPSVTTLTSLALIPAAQSGEVEMPMECTVTYLDGAHPVHAEVDGSLQSASGQQLAVFGSMFPQHPAATQKDGAPRTEIAPEVLETFSLPVGPSGQILGITHKGATMAMLLHDPAVIEPKPVRVDVVAQHFVARQLALRALGSGLAVGVYTTPADLARWSGLVNQFGHVGFAVTTDVRAELPCQLILLDRGVADVDAGKLQHRSIVTVHNPGVAAVPPADLLITQPDPRTPTVRVALAALGEIELRLLLTRHEDRYIGVFDPDETSPRIVPVAQSSLVAAPPAHPASAHREPSVVIEQTAGHLPPVSALAQPPSAGHATATPHPASTPPPPRPANPTGAGGGRHHAQPGTPASGDSSQEHLPSTPPSASGMTREQARARMAEARERAKRRIAGDS